MLDCLLVRFKNVDEQSEMIFIVSFFNGTLSYRSDLISERLYAERNGLLEQFFSFVFFYVTPEKQKISNFIARSLGFIASVNYLSFSGFLFKFSASSSRMLWSDERNNTCIKRTMQRDI